MERIKTGIGALDDVLFGGFPAASMTILAGGPGTGKTMLAQQLAFHHAAAGDTVLYLTTVSEPLHKLLRHVQDFPFFDATLVGTRILYEDLGGFLQKSDAGELLDLVGEQVLRRAPKVVIVDSFKALTDLAGGVADFRRALYRLAGTLSASGCSAFLVGEYSTPELAALPEFAVADGIVELSNERRGLRTYRYLSVVKLRGSDYVDGRHAVSLTKSGLVLYPRFRTPPTPAAYAPTDKRMPTGVANLDPALFGGIRVGSATLVVGPTGTGKTLLALSFAHAAAKRGEHVVFTSFQEDPSQIQQIGMSFGWDLAGDVASGALEFLYVSPVELDLDQHMLKIVDSLERTQARILVVDSVSDFEKSAYDANRFSAYMFSLIQYAKDRSITLVMTLEANKEFAESALTESGVSRIADNVLFLSDARSGDKVRREMRIMKTRGSDHDHDVKEVTLSARGMRVGPDEQRAHAAAPRNAGNA